MNNEQAEALEGREITTVESGLLSVLNKAEIDQQIATAKKYPRSIKRFRDEALQMVTLTEAIAKDCVYALPRKDRQTGQTKTIEGPSARFGEIVASAWGNCRAGARVVGESSEFVTAQGVFHDLERNVSITYEVQRRITGSNGRRYSVDMIGVTANAACSIALRNAILKGVPKAFWAEMYAAARKTIAGDVKTLANRRADAIAEFAIFGVSEQQILATLGKAGAQDITIDDLVTLHGFLTAIRDGDSTPEAIFSQGDAAGVQMPQAKSAKAAETKTKPEPAQQATSKPAGTNGAAQQNGGVPPGVDPGKKIEPSAMRIVQVKLAAKNIAVAEACHAFGIAALDDLQVGKLNSLLDWIAQY